MTPFVDIHTHTVSTENTIIAIVNAEIGKDDALHLSYPFSVGVHPWKVGACELDYALDTIKQITTNSYIKAIGEVGLDKARGAAFEVQLLWFQKQIELSEQLHLPLIIHCVRSYSEVAALRKQSGSKQPWILHGFSGNIQTAQMLLRMGCKLSFGGNLFHFNSRSGEVLQQVDLSQVFLETDVSSYTIAEVYARAAAVLNMELESLKERIYQNYCEVFCS